MATPRRPGRARCQLPACYNEGFLEKKSIKDKMGRKLWTSLCGNSLFFFNNTKDNMYIDKLDLSDLISVTDDCIRDRNLDAARFTLHMKNEEIKMIAPTLESREQWKGFILSVAKLSVPDSLNLLPGQIQMMKEIIEKEKHRRQSSSSPDFNLYVPVISDMPACYYNVSRTEAELRLERYSERGNLLLRPRQDGASFALTTRDVNSQPVFKHYRVSRRHEGGFTLDIDNPITCITLHDIINCMVEKTNGVFKPFLMEGHYEDTITFVETNEENGELNVRRVSNSPLPSPPALFKPPFVEVHEENGERSRGTNSPLPSPPAPPPKPLKKDHRVNSDILESIYLNDTEFSDDDKADGMCAAPSVMPCPAVRLPHQISMPSLISTSSGGDKIALKPPGYPNHVPRSQSVCDMSENKSHAHAQHWPQPAGLTEELNTLFRIRRAMQE